MTAECNHVLRRPGVGVSEVASSVIGGIDVLKSLEHADLGRLGLLLEKDGLMDAFKTLNTHTGGKVSTKDFVDAFTQVTEFIKNADDLEELTIKAGIASSRLYIMLVSLLQLMAGVKDPKWWSAVIPSNITEHDSLDKSKDSPSSTTKMAKAIGRLLKENADRQKDFGKCDSAEGLLSRKKRKASSDADDDEESQSGHKKKHKKKATKTVQKKKKKQASDSSSDTSDTKKSKKQNKTNKKKHKELDTSGDSSDSSSKKIVKKIAKKEAKLKAAKHKSNRRSSASSGSKSVPRLASGGRGWQNANDADFAKAFEKNESLDAKTDDKKSKKKENKRDAIEDSNDSAEQNLKKSIAKKAADKFEADAAVAKTNQ